MARLQIPTASVGLSGLQAARLSPVDNGGEALARGVAQVGAVAGRIAEEKEQTLLNERLRGTREQLNALVEYAASVKDPRNPENWGGREGQSLSEWFKEQAGAVVGAGSRGLTEKAAARHDDGMLGIAEQMRHSVSTHEAQLFEKIDDDTYAANTESSRQAAALTAVSPDGRFAPLAVTLSQTEIMQQVRNYAKRKQLNPVQEQAEMVRQMSPLHAATIQALVDVAKDSASAKKYFEDHKDQMTVPALKEMAAKITVGNDYDIGDRLYQKYVGGLSAENYVERLKQLNAEPELKDRPQVRAHVDQLLKGVVAGQEHAFQAKVRAAVDRVSAVNNSRGLYAALSSREMAELKALDPSTAETKKMHYETEIRIRKNEATREDSVDSMFRLTEMVQSEGFLNRSEAQLKEDMVGMTPQHQMQAVAMWSQYKANSKDWQADKTKVMTSLFNAGIIKNPNELAPKKDKARHEQEGLAFNMAMTAMSMLNREQGKVGGMKPEQQDAALEQLTRKIVLEKNRVFADKTMPVYEVMAKFNNPAYRPVLVQIAQAADKSGTTLNFMRMADVYSRALAEGAMHTKGEFQGFIDSAWLSRQPEFNQGRAPKYAPAPEVPARRGAQVPVQSPGYFGGSVGEMHRAIRGQ